MSEHDDTHIPLKEHLGLRLTAMESRLDALERESRELRDSKVMLEGARGEMKSKASAVVVNVSIVISVLAVILAAISLVMKR